MSTFVALDSQVHQHLKIDTRQIESLGAHERMIPVVISEFLKLVVHYPIAFTKNSETGKFIAVILLGFDEQENLFWNGDQWEGIYTPLNIMRQPFFIGDNNGSGVICIDPESKCLNEANGENIFTASATESPYLKKVKSILSELIQGEEKTTEFIQALLTYKLITPIALDITFANQQVKRLEGLYTIDEDKLAELDSTQLFDLHKKGFLKSAYTMIASLSHIYSLINKKNESLAKQQEQR